MVWRSKTALVLLTAALSCSGQKRWADAKEYELFGRVNAQTDPAQRLTLLRQWTSEYPQTEFQRERLLLMTQALRRAGQFRDAFTILTQALRSDDRTTETATLYFMATLGPELTNPTQEQIAIVAGAAVKLLATKPDPVRETAPPPAAGTMTVAPDPESEQVGEMVREMRRNGQPRLMDPEARMRQAAERALEWAARQKQ